MKAIFLYKMSYAGWKTIVSIGALDNINDPALKLARLANFGVHPILAFLLDKFRDYVFN